MDNAAADVRTLLLARTYLYTLFHKVFGGDPSRELLQALASEATADACAQFAEDSSPLSRLATFLGSLGGGSRDELFGNVRGEYTRMFIGPGRPEALPWESPYVSKEAAFFQESTLLVRQAYKREGLRAKMMTHVPDDHVSLMCAFQAEMGRRATAALGSGDEAALSQALRAAELFAHGHMTTWLSDYAKAARRAKTAYLYPQMIEGLSEFAAIDLVFLSEAAHWAESQPSICAAREADTQAFETELERLASIRLLGLDDNELVELN